MSVENLTQLRREREWTKVQAARSVALGVDVWDRFEQAAILPESLTRAQVERLAAAFEVEAEQFLTLLAYSRPALYPLCQRKGCPPAKPIAAISFALALSRSAMTEASKRLWRHLEAAGSSHLRRKQKNA